MNDTQNSKNLIIEKDVSTRSVKERTVRNRHYEYWPKILNQERKLCTTSPTSLLLLHTYAQTFHIFAVVAAIAVMLCAIGFLIFVGAVFSSPQPLDIKIPSISNFLFFFAESAVIFELSHRILSIVDLYRRATRRTTGSVVDLYDIRVDGKLRSYAVVQFSAQSKLWHMRWQAARSDKIKIGDEIGVMYDPYVPSTSIAECEAQRTMRMLKNKPMIVLFVVVAAVIILPFLAMWLNDMGQIYLLLQNSF